ncbi:uncharacterized protein L199_007960 [Kwoniella botswanensis]|uniref:uncharacterized protein n=1 Tax=Kwoniella botswanensis TaxID=1268659 RepID=UPI00315D5BC8
MAAVAQAPHLLPSTSSSGSISRPSSSTATIKPTENKSASKPDEPNSTSSTSDKPVAKVTVSEATPVDEKGEVKKENGDGEFGTALWHISSGLGPFHSSIPLCYCSRHARRVNILSS